jgi:hypothetical protein
MLAPTVATFDVVLRDGSTLTLRPGRPDDVPALLEFFGALSPQSAYLRFMGYPQLDAERGSAISSLPEEWEEVTSKEEELGYHYSPKCVEICYLADQVDTGALFRKRRARIW